MKIIRSICSPHYNERKKTIRMLVLHATATGTLDETFSYLIDSVAPNRVSAHYVIDRNGQIYQLVPDEKRAWHAGISWWPDMGDDINDVSIGIEFQCPEKNGQLGGFTKKQIKSGTFLCRYLCDRYQIAPKNVVGHSDIAPDRKKDPGKQFPWEIFVMAGLSDNKERR